MGQPALVQITGAVVVSPVTGSCYPGSPSMTDTLQISASAAYGSWKNGRPNVQKPTIGDPYVVPLEGIAKVRFLAFRTQLPMRLLLTTPNGGADQVVPVSDELVLHAPGAGDEMTAIKIVGTGDVTYVIAGDVG